MPLYQEKIEKYSGLFVHYAVLSLAFVLPFFMLPVTWVSFAQAKILLLAGALILVLIAWALQSVASRRIFFSYDPILVVTLCISIAYLLSAIISGNRSSLVSGEALQGTFSSVAMFFGATVAAAVYVRGDRRASVTLLVSILSSASVIALFQLARMFFPEVLSLGGALQGNTASVVGSWHDLSIFMGLTLLCTGALLETSFASEKWRASALYVLAAAACILLVLINFSDTWFAVSGAAFLFAAFRAMRSYRRQRDFVAAVRFAIFWILLAGVSLFMGFAGAFIFSRLPQQVQFSQVEVRPSWQGTFSVSQQVLGQGKTLLFGSGPNSFDQQWAKFKPLEVNSTNFWNVNFQNGIGIVPTALVTVGVLGILSWALLILALLWGGYRTLVEEPDARLRALLFIAAAFLMVFHVIYVPSIAISVLMFLLLGTLVGLNTRTWLSVQIEPMVKNAAYAGAIGVIVLMVLVSSAMEARTVVSTLYAYRGAALYAKNPDVALAVSYVNKAVQIDSRNDIAQRAAVEVGLLQFSKLVAAPQADASSRAALQKTLSDTIAHGLKAVSIDNSNYQNWLALAGLYQSLAGVGIQGAYQQAQSAYLHAASTTPTNPLPFLQLGQIAMTQGNYADATNYLSTAIKLKPNLALPYYLRSQIEASKGEFQPAVQDAALAAQIANQDPQSWYNLGVILYMGNDLQNAGAAFEKAVSLQGEYSDALFALAVVYDRIGQHPAALAMAQKVLSLNPTNPTIAKVMENLTQGKPALDGLGAQAGQQSPPKK